jgi:hypothetical protein
LLFILGILKPQSSMLYIMPLPFPRIESSRA